MIKQIFKNFKVNFDKLVSFGFVKGDEGFVFKKDIMDGQLSLSVIIGLNGEIKTKTIDKTLDEEYVLHLTKDAVGGYVGEVRKEIEGALLEIKENCFDQFIFKSRQAIELIGYVKAKYGDNLEYLWEKFPNNAIWRRKDNRKWYGAILTVQKKKLGLVGDEMIEIIDLRMEPDEIEKTIDNRRYFAGYHMNKKHWLTICLDESVDTKEICERLDTSFLLAKK